MADPYFSMARQELERLATAGNLDARMELQRRQTRRANSQWGEQGDEVAIPLLPTRATKLPIEPASKPVRVDSTIPVHIEMEGEAEIEAMLAGKRAPSGAYYTSLVRNKHALREFDDQFELLCNDFLESRITILPHQIEAAKTVFTEMNLRAILADEVGLGKTIEAGIIAKELDARGMLQSILVISPKTLMAQWQDEFKEKFDIQLDDLGKMARRDFDDVPFVVANLRSWYREDSVTREMVLGRPWDLVIIDEAHHFKNHAGKGYRALAGSDTGQGIRAKYMLLLTATPVENELQELFSLLHLVRPGALGSFRDFKDRFYADKAGQIVKNEAQLKRLVRANMIRRRRIECGIDYTAREPKTDSLDFPAQALRAYERILDIELPNDLSKITYVRLLSSSIAAFRRSAQEDPLLFHSPEMKDLWEPLRKLEEAGEPKMAALKAIVDGRPRSVVFTEFRATQSAITRYLRDSGGILVHELNGNMTLEQRRRAIRDFKDKGGVFVSTPTGAEGINLQFADTVVNFDLPWNPMKVEQRVGRVHRIGQKETVKIFSLAYRGTIEDFILATLYRKLNLFRMSVGEIDGVLTGDDSSDYELETDLRGLINRRASLAEIRERLEEVATERAQAKASHRPQMTLMERVA